MNKIHGPFIVCDSNSFKYSGFLALKNGLKSNIIRMLAKLKQHDKKSIQAFSLLRVNGSREQFNCVQIEFNILANTHISEQSLVGGMRAFLRIHCSDEKFSLLSHRLLYTLMLLPHKTLDNFAIKSAYSTS